MVVATSAAIVCRPLFGLKAAASQSFEDFPRPSLLDRDDFTPEKNIRVAAPASGSPAAGRTLTSCGILDRAGTKYVLAGDVSSAGTCFSVQADGITLDLGGHTITYGVVPPKAAAYAILGIACWDTALTNGIANGNVCGGKFDSLTVMNGRIMQAPGMAPHSDAIHLGQGGGNRLDVHDLEITVNGDSANPIHTIYSGEGSQIHNNIIHNNVRSIRNRHQLQGMSVKFDNSESLKAGQSVHDNQILGGAQGGIYLITPGSTAYGNKIGQNGRYSNDFSIYMWGNRQEVRDNEIDVVSGRGIQIAGGAVNTGGSGKGGKRSMAGGNKIRVIELKQNCDYSEKDACNVCQLGGAYGIQFDDNPQGDTSSHNVVLARAADCPASALRITDSEVPENESRDDSFTAIRESPKAANAYGWDNAGPTAFRGYNSTFIGDTASYHVDWDGAQNEICMSCTFGKGVSNPDPKYVTFSFQNGGKILAKNIHFQDPKFLPGAAKDSTNLRPIDESNWPGFAEYFIDWTVTLLLQDQQSKPVQGADVSITDALGNSAFKGKTDQLGKISLPLTEFRMYNTATHVIQEPHTPYQIMVSMQNCTVDASATSLDVREATSRIVGLNCQLK
jgi:hypothetical protein